MIAKQKSCHEVKMHWKSIIFLFAAISFGIDAYFNDQKGSYGSFGTMQQVLRTSPAAMCSEQILEQKKRALQAKEAVQQEHLRNVEADRQSRETERAQAKARRIVEAQRAQQRAALDLQQKTAYFQVFIAVASKLPKG